MAVKCQWLVACALIDHHVRARSFLERRLVFKAVKCQLNEQLDAGSIMNVLTLNVQLNGGLDRRDRVSRFARDRLQMHLFAQFEIEQRVGHSVQQRVANEPSW